MMTMLTNNKLYNKLKFVALILLPAGSSLYFGLAQVWALPNTEKIVGTMTVLDTFLGVLLGLSTVKYNRAGVDKDGDLVVNEVDGEKYLALAVNKSVEAMAAKDNVTLRVVTQKPTV